MIEAKGEGKGTKSSKTGCESKIDLEGEWWLGVEKRFERSKTVKSFGYSR